MNGQYLNLKLNPKKIDWYGYQSNNHEWAISQLKLHPEKIDW